MQTSMNNSKELRKVLNENLHGILTRKRPLLMAKEVNNTAGKMLTDVKIQLIDKGLRGDKSGLDWFGDGPDNPPVLPGG